MRVGIFVEGGAKKNAAIRKSCRQGFRDFLSNSGVNTKHLDIIPSGPGSSAYQEYVQNAKRSFDIAVLLVDSESAVDSHKKTYKFLQEKFRHERKIEATQPVFLMVQCMESWLLSDIDAILKFYRPNPRPKNLVQHSADLELFTTVRASDEINKIASRSAKKIYTKAHGFEILSTVDPSKVMARFQQADALIKLLKKHLN